MKQRLVILTEIISPYRIPLFNCLARREEVDLHVIFLAETDLGLRQWQVYKEEIRFSHEVLPSWRKKLGKYNVLVNRGVSRALRAASPDAIVCGGYNYIASWQSLLWARAYQVPFLLWTESNLQDLRDGHALVEFLKAEFIGHCSAFLAAGQSARKYLRAHKVGDDRIYTAPDAVDNDRFAAAAACARKQASECRQELGLPDRYFLFTGRLVREKGVFELLSAYATLEPSLRQRVGLIYAGDGPCRQALQERAAAISPGTIKSPGFVQRDELAKYYALADVLILPTHSDPWGLVVNEAMACGLPVIVSEIAGCAADLVKPGWNGLLVPPADASTLAVAMRSLGDRQELCRQMGDRSRQHILRYSPEEWASGVCRAIAGLGRE